MKGMLKYLVFLAAVLLSGSSILLLINFFPDGIGNAENYFNAITLIWMRVGFSCAVAVFAWIGLFAPMKKALLIAIGMWIVIGTFYTALEVSMRYRMITAVDLLHSSDYWTPIHAANFKDGGSVALGILNENGEVIYLWAYPPPDQGEDQLVYLQLNYNDPNAVKVCHGSDLEREILSMLAQLMIIPSQEQYLSLIEEFHAVMLDRSTHIGKGAKYQL